MRVITLLSIVPIAVGLGACADDAWVPGDDLAAQAMVVNNSGISPESVRIRSISWAGSGCPAGSVFVSLSSDFSMLTMLFDSYVVELGPGVPLNLSRRNCQIVVDLEFPQGWSFSVSGVENRASVNLDPGVCVVQRSAYSFQGESDTAPLQTTLCGPKVGDYQIGDTLDLGGLVWSPCGAHRALIINSEIRLENHGGNPNARGLVTFESMDGKVAHVYGVQWRRCTT